LVDPNETLEESALRELKEETGYLGEVVRPGGAKEPLIFHSGKFDMRDGRCPLC